MSLLKAFMMEKPNYMYATIKGSLTENDGVFSGFSASNYLQLQNTTEISQISTFEKWEIQLRFSITEIEINNAILVYSGSSSSNRSIQISKDGAKLRVSMSYTGTSNDLLSATNIYTFTSNDINSYFSIKIEYNNGTYNFYLQKNNNAFSKIYYFNSANKMFYNSPFMIGSNDKNTSEYFRGSIDLNQSYIKLGSTKYKLQAVVGYTVVGSPTITDGVVSGFSSGNYLTIPETNLDLKNTVFHCKFKTGNDLTTPQSIMQFGRTGQTLPMLFYIDSNKAWCFYSGKNTGANAYTRIEIILSANTEYEIEFGTKNTKRYLKFGFVGNMQNISLTAGTDENWNGSIAKPTYFGNAGTSLTTAFSGSIDLNNTYIKINNKLWFNGQQA